MRGMMQGRTRNLDSLADKVLPGHRSRAETGDVSLEWTPMNEGQDVVKSIRLEISPGAEYFWGAFLAFVFAVLIIAPFIATDGLESGVAIAFWYAGLGIVAAIIVSFALRSPRHVRITTRGKIRFDSLMFKREYDLKTHTWVKVVEDDEGSRNVRLVFSDGQSYTFTPPYQNQYHELVDGI
jgi:hypothetical protein